MVAFIATFGFSNVFNNYAIVGPSIVFWWVFLAVFLYFIASMFAEMASFHQKSSSGLYIWTQHALGSKVAFFTAWLYFVANIFYFSTLSSRIPVFFSWVYGSYDSLSLVNDQMDFGAYSIITASSGSSLFLLWSFISILFATFLVIFYERWFDALSRFVGLISIVVSGGFVLLSFLALLILPDVSLATPLNSHEYIPYFNTSIAGTLAWVIFAVAGSESIGTLLNQAKEPKRFPRAIFIAVILIALGYIISSLALSSLMPQKALSLNNIDQVMPLMYARLGEYFGFGTWFLRLCMLGYAILTIIALLLWLAMNVKTLCSELPKGELPAFLRRVNAYGTPINSLIFQVVLVALFLLMLWLPSFFSKVSDSQRWLSATQSVQNVYYKLYDFSTLGVVIPYIILPLAYIGYKIKRTQSEFMMTKNKIVGILIGSSLSLLSLLGAFFIVFKFEASSLPNPSNFLNLSDRTLWLITSLGGLLFFVFLGFLLRLYSKMLSR